MKLDEAFDKLIAGETVQYVETEGKPTVGNFRTMLTRKFRVYKETMDKYGYLGDSLGRSGISCKKCDGYYEFVLNKQKRVPVDYTILMDETNDSNVPEDLAESSGLSAWFTSAGALPFTSSEPSDPSSTQGEDSELRSDEEDWGTNIRTTDS